jgi:ATP-dependent RNA helicase DeaD
MPFSSVPPILASALAKRGYETPTPVQAAVLAADAADRDLLVSAQTGSGKTVAYGLALAPTLLTDDGRLPAPRSPLALVIAPTRELAQQVQRELEWLYEDAGARIVPCVGGMDARREQRALQAGCHIVVGTPGRLRDHVERGHLDMSGLRAVVLDEADEMLDLGFREDLEAILDTATGENRRTLLFSATLPRAIAAMAKRYQKDALRIVGSADETPHGDIDYRVVTVAPHEIEHAVVNVLRYFEARGALVFCATRDAVRHLAGSLIERGFGAVALSGELSQAERSNALQSLRDGRARVCVATDVAARGLDLPDLGLVIHVDLPRDRQVFLHRSGRTGRAGRKGSCVMMVPYNQRRLVERRLESLRINATWSGPPSADDVRTKDRTRLVDLLTKFEAPSDEDREAATALMAQHNAEALALAVVQMHRATLPAPEELYVPTDNKGGGDNGKGGYEGAIKSAPREPREQREPRERAAYGSPESGPRETHGDNDRPTGNTVWFRTNIGRMANADPRWLIPAICRKGHITKAEIGEIRIHDKETRFEIDASVAARFTEAVRKPDPQDRDLRIEPVGDGGAPLRRGASKHGYGPRPGGGPRPPRRPNR